MTHIKNNFLIQVWAKIRIIPQIIIAKSYTLKHILDIQDEKNFHNIFMKENVDSITVLFFPPNVLYPLVKIKMGL